MADRLIVIHNVEGQMMCSRVLRSSDNVEYYSQNALDVAVSIFKVKPDDLSVSLQDDWNGWSFDSEGNRKSLILL
jgi:hypothetical protein